MKTNLLIFLLLLAGAGIQTKACDTVEAVDSHLIKLASEAGEQIHLAASQLYLIPKSQVSHLMFECKKKLTTGEITCRIPNQFVSTLQGSSLISQFVSSQNKQTLLSLVFKSSKRGASMGAIIGGVVGAFLLGKSLYKILRYSENLRGGKVIEVLKAHLACDLAVTFRLPQLLLGHKYTIHPLAMYCERLIDHSPLPKEMGDSVFLMLTGIIEWALSGALVGAVAGPVVLALNPYQAVSVALTVAHKQS